jgi:hypothetical protein
MLFNIHSHLVGKHAFLSASKYHWINYNEDKLARMYVANLAAVRGTELHAFAHEAIRLGIKLPANGKTLSMYVNDALGYRMVCEQILRYSDNAFGTADTIIFRRNKLRVHDLKNGVTPASEHQLEVYAALFCLEYGFKPVDIDIELRIYQNDEIRIYEGDPDLITHIMSKIILFDRQIDAIRQEVLS